MKKLSVFFLFVVLCGLVFQDAVSAPAQITNITASASTTYNNRLPLYAVNGAGLTGDQHTAVVADFVSWMNASDQSIPAQWFIVDFGVQMPLTHFKLWNFNWKHPTVDTLARGIKLADIYVSGSVSSPGSDFSNTEVWTFVKSVTFPKAPGVDTYTGEPDVDILGHTARWLAIDIRSNHGGDTVGISELQIFADNRPVIVAEVPDTVATNQAAITGMLEHDGGEVTDVYAFVGADDGGMVSSAWDRVFYVGRRFSGPVETNVSVIAGTEYFCRFQAINQGGTNWSDVVCFYTGGLSVGLPAEISEGAFTLPVTFSRPAGVTNTTLVLEYTVSGEAQETLDYIVVSNRVELPAGAESVQVEITLVDDLFGEPDEDLVVALLPGPFVADGGATNATVITDDDGYIKTDDWSFHMNATFSGYSGVEALANFPCVLRLSESIPGFSYADFSCQSDGGDLRVTDPLTGQTLLHEIEHWDPAGTSIVWVSVASLTGTATSIALHWGNPEASLPAYTQSGGIWSIGFAGVWHLAETAALDSTINNNHGTAHDNSTVPAILGNGQFFDGNDYVVVPHDDSIGGDVTSSLTVSLWMNSKVTMPANSDVNRMLEKGDCYFFVGGYGSKGGATFLVKQTGLISSTGVGVSIPSNEWHHVCGTYDGSKLRMYYDGVLKSSVDLVGGIDDDGEALRIGSDDANKFFFGTLDETRIESAVRGPDWIKACYDNQKLDSDFITFGEVAAPPGGTLIMIY